MAAVALASAVGLALAGGASAGEQTPLRVAAGAALGGGGLLSAPAGASAKDSHDKKGGALGGGSLLGGGLLQGPPAGGAAGGGTVFTGEPAKPPQPTAKMEAKAEAKGAAEHAALYKESDFPSALQCGVCHPKQFREWSMSQHAYAEISPVFHAFQHSINAEVNGSNGDFCARCHSAIAGYLSESADSATLERHAISREGITCITCHRISKAYNKVSGRFGLNPGEITQPVYGPFTDKVLKSVIKAPKYHVQPNPKKVGLHIHADAVYFAPIKSSTFCGSCHDVTLFNGFRLEEAFSEYRTAPAAARGVTCQDCHMGKIQGKVSGYVYGPAAVVNGIPTPSRPLTNHMFSGPDYPIVHPGLFPFDKRAQDLANVNQWTTFDYKAGWGTDAFEKHVSANYKFPPHWQSVDDRYDAAKIVQDHLKLLQVHKAGRLQVLRNGYGLGGVRIVRADPAGVGFDVVVRNLTDGHNVPTGFTEERAVWLQVTVTDPHGKVVFKSGDRDPNGDLRDDHSEWVRSGRVPVDEQLFNLQGVVLIRDQRGGEQPAVLPIPFSLTALPYIRPSTFSQIMLGRPMTTRDQKRSIDPLGYRVADYHVEGEHLTGPGVYHVSVKLMSQTVPVNLILAEQYVGFDYHMSPKTVIDDILDGAVAVAQRQFDITVK